MYKLGKTIITMLLIFSMSISSFASVNNNEKERIEEEFYDIIDLIKQGRIDEIENVNFDASNSFEYLFQHKDEEGNNGFISKILEILNDISEVAVEQTIGQLPLSDYLFKIGGFLQNETNKLYGVTDKEIINCITNIIDFDVINIEKNSDIEYIMSIAVESPTDDYHKELNSHLLEKFLKNNVLTLPGMTIAGNVYLPIKKFFVDSFKSLDYKNYGRKTSNIKLKVEVIDNNYIFDFNSCFEKEQIENFDKNILFEVNSIIALLYYESSTKYKFNMK